MYRKKGYIRYNNERSVKIKHYMLEHYGKLSALQHGCARSHKLRIFYDARMQTRDDTDDDGSYNTALASNRVTHSLYTFLYVLYV